MAQPHLATGPQPTPSSWQRTLWVMALVQCVMMMAFSSMGPFLPFFIEQLGVKDMRHVELWAGVISSSNFLISAIVSPMWGAVADRKGRKLMVLRSTFAISFFTLCMGLVSQVWQLLVIRIFQGVFSGFSASATALVATRIPEEKLGFALGWLQSAGLVGTLVGPLLGGVVVDHVHNYRMVFFLTSVFAFTAFLITLLLVKENREAPTVSSKRKPTLFQQFKSIGQMKDVRVMFVVLFLAQYSVANVQPIISVYIKQLVSHSDYLTAYLGTIAGFAIAMTGLADLIASPFLGKRSDTLGYRRVLTICMIGAGLFYLPQALAPNIWVFIASRFGLGLFVGGIIPTANALIGRLTPKEQRGQVYGFTASATFLGSFAGPLFGSLGSAAFGIRVMLGVTSVLYLLNMIWVRTRVTEPEKLDVGV
jgi:MFS transporter, DHA1 family, multidrug resistance protein